MVRFGMRRRRRFGRRRVRRRAAPRRLLRKARLIRKAGLRKIQRKKERKNRKIKKNIWGYMDSTHADAAHNQTVYADLTGAANYSGLGNIQDMIEVFQQVHQIDDFIYAAQTGVSPQMKANRANLKISVSAKATYYISHNSNAGGIYCQIYICRPRRSIPIDGIGKSNDLTPGSCCANNLNSRSQPDYNDASAITVNAAGTGGVTNILQNSTTTTKPTVSATDHWVTPFMVPEFTTHWKVVKVHKVFLPPNGNFMFKMKLPLTTLRRQEFGLSALNNNGDKQILGRFGLQAFIRFHGEPSSDNTTDTLVNFCEASINCVIDKKYEFSYGVQPQYFTVRGTDHTGTVAATTKNAEGTAAQAEL